MVATPSGSAQGLGLLVFEEACLVALRVLDDGPLRIGRAQDCGLRLSDAEVSRHHCELEAREGALWLRDVGSANGCRVGGRTVTRAALRHGDTLQIGQTLIRVLACRSQEWRLHHQLFRQLYFDPDSRLLNTRGLRLHLRQHLPFDAAAGALCLALVAVEASGSGDVDAAACLDQVAADIADALHREAPESAVAARLGVSEFALLWCEPQPAHLPVRGERLRRQVADTVPSGWTVRIGVAWQARPGTSIDTLLGSADAALHPARRNSRMCEVRCVDPSD